MSNHAENYHGLHDDESPTETREVELPVVAWQWLDKFTEASGLCQNCSINLLAAAGAFFAREMKRKMPMLDMAEIADMIGDGLAMDTLMRKSQRDN